MDALTLRGCNMLGCTLVMDLFDATFHIFTIWTKALLTSGQTMRFLSQTWRCVVVLALICQWVIVVTSLLAKSTTTKLRIAWVASYKLRDCAYFIGKVRVYSYLRRKVIHLITAVILLVSLLKVSWFLALVTRVLAHSSKINLSSILRNLSLNIVDLNTFLLVCGSETSSSRCMIPWGCMWSQDIWQIHTLRKDETSSSLIDPNATRSVNLFLFLIDF